VSLTVTSFRFARLARTAAALWLCSAAAAWAGGGGGGEDLGSLNAIATSLCDILNALNITSTCPPLPTISQAALEVAAKENTPPEAVRATNNIVMGNHVDAGNPSRPPALNPITSFPVSGSALSSLLSSLTPLAFSSQNQAPAPVRKLYNPAADTFVYALASGPSVQPTNLYLFFEDVSRTNANLPQGQIVAKIAFLLTVLNKDGITERAVPTTLQFRVPSSGGAPCSASTFVGDFNGSGGTQTQSVLATDIGVDCAVAFGASAISTKTHAIFELQLPLLLTGACNPNPCPPSPNTDSAYFALATISPYSDVSFLPVPPLSPLASIPFLQDELGAPSSKLGPMGQYIGVAPSAGPVCGGDVTCPATNAKPPHYALCANLPAGNGNGQAPIPAVAGFYAIATDGETYLSAPIVPEGIPPTCPTMPG
jgi:hypothetical protein